MSALLKQDCYSEEFVLTPRGKDIYPGTWTRDLCLPPILILWLFVYSCPILCPSIRIYIRCLHIWDTPNGLYCIHPAEYAIK